MKMNAKTNIRSIRFSDEMAEIIEQQVGDSFTAKFERLIYNAYMMVEAKEQEAKELDKRIERQREELRKLQTTYRDLRLSADRMTGCIDSVMNYLKDL